MAGKEKDLRELNVIREGFKVIALTVAAACVYGIAHDMVTAHACPAYFLPPYHISLVGEAPPFVLALVWGVVATWWLGLPLGAMLALACLEGPWPIFSVRRLVGPILVLIGLMLSAVFAFGFWLYAGFGPETLDIPLSPDSERRLAVVGIMHLTSYIIAPIGAVLFCLWVWWKRIRMGEAAGQVAG